jgi:hypothetical protein
MPYSPIIYYTSNNMGKVFFWIFAVFPWNPLTKGILDMSAAGMNPIQKGESAVLLQCGLHAQHHSHLERLLSF